MPGEGADERSNSILRFGRDPYILLAAWDSILGTGLVGESKFCGKYGTAGGMKLRLENPRGVGVLARCNLALAPPWGVRSSWTAEFKIQVTAISTSYTYYNVNYLSPSFRMPMATHF